eukprot:4377505-Pleurochrysis_carterae.AAC.4
MYTSGRALCQTDEDVFPPSATVLCLTELKLTHEGVYENDVKESLRRDHAYLHLFERELPGHDNTRDKSLSFASGSPVHCGAALPLSQGAALFRSQGAGSFEASVGSRKLTSSNPDIGGHFSSHDWSGSSHTGTLDSSIGSSSLHASSVQKLPGVWDIHANMQAKTPIPPGEDCRRIAAGLLQLRAQCGWLSAARSASAASYPWIRVITLTAKAQTDSRFVDCHSYNLYVRVQVSKRAAFGKKTL